MKIEKGKLYKDAVTGKLSVHFQDSDTWSDKIAVHCSTKEDIDYVFKHYNFNAEWNILGDLYLKNLPNVFIFLESESWAKNNNDRFGNSHHTITIDQFKEFYPPISKEEQKELIVELSNSEPYPEFVISNKTDDNVQNTQPHYDNTHGSLYQVAEQRKWNSYQFDIVKRIDRALKKGQFKEDLQKTKDLIDLWLREESN